MKRDVRRAVIAVGGVSRKGRAARGELVPVRSRGKPQLGSAAGVWLHGCAPRGCPFGQQQTVESELARTRGIRLSN